MAGGLRGASSRVGLRGIGPALAGNVGAGSAFALSRDGNQDVDVPMLAPARSRCRFVEVQVDPNGQFKKGRSRRNLLCLVAEDEYRRAFLAPEALEFVRDRGGHVDEGTEDEIVVAITIQVAGVEGDPAAGDPLA